MYQTILRHPLIVPENWWGSDLSVSLELDYICIFYVHQVPRSILLLEKRMQFSLAKTLRGYKIFKPHQGFHKLVWDILRLFKLNYIICFSYFHYRPCNIFLLKKRALSLGLAKALWCSFKNLQDFTRLVQDSLRLSWTCLRYAKSVKHSITSVFKLLLHTMQYVPLEEEGARFKTSYDSLNLWEEDEVLKNSCDSPVRLRIYTAFRGLF